jgi:hypothetical protein
MKKHIGPNPDEPEPSRCMTSSQKIEVGHTLKSKGAAAVLLFKPSETSSKTSVCTIWANPRLDLLK